MTPAPDESLRRLVEDVVSDQAATTAGDCAAVHRVAAAVAAFHTGLAAHGVTGYDALTLSCRLLDTLTRKDPAE